MRTITIIRDSTTPIPDADGNLTGLLDLLFGYAQTDPVTSVIYGLDAYTLTREDGASWTESYTFANSADTNPIFIHSMVGTWRPSQASVHRGIREKLFALRAQFGLTSLSVTYA